MPSTLMVKRHLATTKGCVVFEIESTEENFANHWHCPLESWFHPKHYGFTQWRMFEFELMEHSHTEMSRYIIFFSQPSTPQCIGFAFETRRYVFLNVIWVGLNWHKLDREKNLFAHSKLSVLQAYPWLSSERSSSYPKSVREYDPLLNSSLHC